MRSRTIDLNADLGEHDGERYPADEALLAIVSSASIACGGHAGSRDVMERTARAAAELGVSIGAHPSYPDREGFGRADVAMSPGELITSVRAQVELLAECCERAGASLKYVKPHGALYNRAVKDRVLARALAECFRSIDPRLAVLTLPEGALEKESASAGLTAVREAFIDRAYAGDGSLAPRGTEGAMLTDPEVAAGRAVQMALYGTVAAIDGAILRVSPQSLCVHGDSADALTMVMLTRVRMEEAGISIRSFV